MSLTPDSAEAVREKQTTMKAKYDTTTVKLTPRFIKALKELMAAQCEMMQIAEPKFKDCWTWGQCDVTDLSKTNGLSFMFGGDDETPKCERFSVTTSRTTKTRTN